MVTAVITTCRRDPDTVERAVRSVIAQTYTDWELIVVDDSPEQFAQRAEVGRRVRSFSGEHDVRYLPNPENRGACYSRNVGLREAKGEYIAFLDDDDEWLPQKLEGQVRGLREAPAETALVYSPYISVDATTNEKKTVATPGLSGMLYEELMRRGNFIGGMSMPLMRTEAVRAVGGFDEPLQSMQDYDLWLRLSQRYGIRYLDGPNVLYYIHGGEQITSNPKKKIAGLERVMEKNGLYIAAHREIGARLTRSLSWYYARSGDRKEAFRLWRRSVRLRPSEARKNLRQLLLITLKTGRRP